MRSAVRWWVPAILFASACSGTVEIQMASGTSSDASTGTGGATASSSAGTGGLACGGMGGAGDMGGSGSEESFCHPYFELPHAACDTRCLVQLAKGSAPAILYERPNDTAFSPWELLAITDDYVIATAYWGTADWADPDALWGVVEIPRTGEPPVLVDTFGKSVGLSFHTAGWVGGDGYFYYHAEVEPPGMGPASPAARRVSTTHLGQPATVLASLPSASWSMAFAVDAGHVYMAGEWGIGRVPKSGGALEVLLDQGATPIYGSAPGAIAVNDGFLYYSVYSAACSKSFLQRIPVAGGTPETIATGWGRLLFGGSPATLFAAEDEAVRRFDASVSTATTILETNTGRYDGMELVGTRLYVLDQCPATIPDGPSGGTFVRTYDIVTGTTGYLEDEPDYPFVPGPTGITHDATGATLFYIE